jgi:hypothetical protein
MDFIEQLKSVGGVKPCQFSMCDKGILPGDMYSLETHERTGPVLCAHCHGTGQILDLAPLLAKPWVLDDVVRLLLQIECFNERVDLTQVKYVVGPQRAHSLVYEVARQLGGTAVVAVLEWTQQHRMFGSEFVVGNYRLSLPIPDNATVLFVTDRVNKETIKWMEPVIRQSGSHSTLPYALCLVNDLLEDVILAGTKIISLHKEQ